MKPKKIQVQTYIEQYFPETVSEYVMTYVMHAHNYCQIDVSANPIVIIPADANYQAHLLQAASYISIAKTPGIQKILFVTIEDCKEAIVHHFHGRIFWGRKWKKTQFSAPATATRYRAKHHPHIEEQLPFIRVLSDIENLLYIHIPKSRNSTQVSDYFAQLADTNSKIIVLSKNNQDIDQHIVPSKATK